MKFTRILLVMAAVGCLVVSIGYAQGQTIQDEQIDAYIEMMRKDIRAERNSIVDQSMGLEPAAKAKFWGVYDKYSKEVKSYWDQRIENIKKYADNFENMNDAIAEELATKALDLEAQQLQIQKKYYGQMKDALGARVAGRFLQVESRLNGLLNLQIGSEIPLIK